MKIGDDVVTVIQRDVRTDGNGNEVRDAYGNRLYVESSTQVTGCAVQPGASTEDNSDASRTVSAATVYAPIDTWTGRAGDAVQTSDGRRWEVDGAPRRWVFGDLSHYEATLREVIG